MLYLKFQNEAIELYRLILKEWQEPIILSESMSPTDFMAVLSMIYYSTSNQNLKTMITECIKALVKIQTSGVRFDVDSARRMASTIMRGG